MKLIRQSVRFIGETLLVISILIKTSPQKITDNFQSKIGSFITSTKATITCAIFDKQLKLHQLKAINSAYFTSDRIFWLSIKFLQSIN